jgi:hypothetical protein
MEVHTSMWDTSKAMVATSMATSTMEDSGETTPMVTTMGTTVTTMEGMVSAASTQMARRISPTSPASSARRMGTTPTLAQRTSQMMLLNLTHFIRDR